MRKHPFALGGASLLLGVSMLAATAHGSSLPWLASVSNVARLRPRPGDSREMASSKLVLPAPLGPMSTRWRLSRSSAAAA